MNCPSADKLSQYVDELLEPQEHQVLKLHINTCQYCKRAIELFEAEAHFIKNTLQTPDLPADFDAHILAKVQPYKKKSLFFKLNLPTAAATVLGIGLFAMVTPSLAQFISKVFSTEQVDVGINEAQKLGFVEQVDIEVTSKGITLHIDEIMVDTKRIAFVVHATDRWGKLISPPEIDEWGEPFDMTFTKTNGEPISDFLFGAGYSRKESYVVVQIDTPKLTEDLRLQWQIDQVNGKQGDWYFDIPIPIEKALPHLKIVDLQQTITTQDTEITLEQMAFTPSSATLNYRIKRQQPLPKDTRVNQAPCFDMAFTITDEQGALITSNSTYRDYIEEIGIPPLTASGVSDNGDEWQWEAVFSTISAAKPVLNIVGIEKTAYVNEEVTFIPNQLDHKAVLYVGGYPIQIASMKQQRKGEPRVEIILNYDDELPFQLEQWYIVDETGTNYYNGREDNKLIILKDMDFDKTYTFTLLTTSKFEPLDKPIRIPLYE